ncbi:MAG: hypothetical protein ACTS8S_00130 [Giesbergeria sp.]
MTGDELLKQQRSEEAQLLICRLILEWNASRKLVAEIAANSLDAGRMLRDPSYVADNLAREPSALVYFDLQRLLTLVRQGF